MSTPQALTCQDAAHLFLAATGLAGPSWAGRSLTEVTEALGFIQVDSINVVARAHELIAWSRTGGGRTGWLDGGRDGADPVKAGRVRGTFEAFTHDASLVPLAWYPFWRTRWQREGPRIRAHAWWKQLLGPDADTVAAHVLARITEEGPLSSADFEHPEKRGPWWGWKPQKAALDYLWRIGALAVSHRRRFQKHYDLPERVFPEVHAVPEPDPDAHREWACATAAQRLGVFTPRELAAFWAALEVGEAKTWCDQALKAGRIHPAQVASADGSAPQRAFVVDGWEARLREIPEPGSDIRLLCPFDPLVRDRARLLRRFGFDYRFEAFVPEARRTYGYYVLPLLEGDRLVGRLDPKFHRGEGLVEVRGLWWEPGVKPTRARLKALDRALEALASWLGAREVRGPGKA